MGTITVATFNVWGYGEPWRYAAERGIARGAVPGSSATTLRPPEGIWSRRRPLIVAALRAARADLIGLQEVAAVPTADSVSQAAQVADDLGYRHVIIPAPPGGDKGLALLARDPISAARALPVPFTGMGADHYQAAMQAIVTTPHGPINVVMCHLTPRDEDARLRTIDYLRATIAALPSAHPYIVLGDFNAAPTSPTILRLTATPDSSDRDHCPRDAWLEAHPDDRGPTMPSHDPMVRIDYILIGAGITVIAAERIGTSPDTDGFYASDHLGVAAMLHW